ncbi:MAG: DeoR/GlpR transcriptional regulator [Clostridia bacterium]|nr:DeoR/GlpR transcriptional regulator [Clostridia bacterium]
MLIAERQQKILQIIERQGGATVEELVRMLYASAPTIRRDLTAMEQNGLIQKVYGGAIPLTAANREIPLNIREQSQSSAKDRMAERAASHVRNGMVILMDGSSSVNRIVKYLDGFKDLIVVTSGAKTAVDLAERNITTLCTGGQLLNHSLSYVGHKAEEFVRGINADLLFFSCHGINEEGLLTDLAMEEVHLRQLMLKQAKKSVLLCDRSKYDKTYFYTLCHKDDIDIIITE